MFYNIIVIKHLLIVVRCHRNMFTNLTIKAVNDIMSIVSWLLKPKKKMTSPTTKTVRIGKYKISSHAQNRIAQKDRGLSKWGLIDNLFTKPNAVSSIKGERPFRSYNRIGRRMTTSINPGTNVIATARRVSEAEKRKYNLIKRGNKYVKKGKR